MDDQAGTSANEALGNATSSLERAVRARVRAVPAAEIRRRGRARRQRRTTAVTAAGAAVLIGVTVLGHSGGGALGGVRTVNPAGGDPAKTPAPDSSLPLQIPSDFLPVSRLPGLLGGSWTGATSADASQAQVTMQDCQSAATEMTTGGRAAVTIYVSATNVGLAEVVSRFPDAARAHTAFVNVSSALSVCADNADPSVAGPYDESSRSALVIRENRATERDPSRVSHWRIKQSGPVLVLLAKSEVTTDADPAAHAVDPLVSAMTAAVARATGAGG